MCYLVRKHLRNCLRESGCMRCDERPVTAPRPDMHFVILYTYLNVFESAITHCSRTEKHSHNIFEITHAIRDSPFRRDWGIPTSESPTRNSAWPECWSWAELPSCERCWWWPLRDWKKYVHLRYGGIDSLCVWNALLFCFLRCSKMHSAGVGKIQRKTGCGHARVLQGLLDIYV